jgi:hypothetical protein
MKVDYQSRVQEIELIHDELEFHLNYVDEENNVVQRAVSKFDFSNSRKIQTFVAHLITTKSSIFRFIPLPHDPTQGNFEPTAIARKFSPYDFIFKFNIHVLTYPESLILSTFLGVLRNWMYRHNNTQTGTFPYLAIHNTSVEHLAQFERQYINELSDILRMAFQDELLKTQLASNNIAANVNYKNYCEYVDKLLRHESLTFICLEFSVRKSFFNNGRSTHALAGLVGYIGKWEFSYLKGPYFRAILIFPTSKVVQVKALSEQIAHYWVEEITQGAGICYQAKLAAKTPQLKKLSCVIKQGDEKLLSLFKERVVAYITKSEKYWMPVQLLTLLTDESNSNKTTVKNSAKKTRNAYNTTFRGHERETKEESDE